MRDFTPFRVPYPEGKRVPDHGVGYIALRALALDMTMRAGARTGRRPGADAATPITFHDGKERKR
ncbi:hypothetical protein ACFV2H_29625 [Streptomyces sp. NPDC059629]|uniref:hypothetical protein n=1 Tax=Streptomyces sp. NPDC059629 TaxID=3346889 RepID=UPI0036BE7C41